MIGWGAGAARNPTNYYLNVNLGEAETLAVPCATRTEQQGFWVTALGAVTQNPLNQN